MKSSYIVNIAAVAALLLGACQSRPARGPHAGHGEGAVIDSSLTALTRPVNEQVIADIPAITPEYGTRILTSTVNGVVTYDTRRQTGIASRVSGRIERLLIKYNYQPVRKGQLIMEIYSPDLAAAQRELLFIAAAGDRDMLARARQRLQLLGMQPAQITQVLQTGNILYRVPVFSNSNGYILERPAAAAAPAAAAMSAPVSGSGGGMGGMEGGSNPAPVPAPAAPIPTPVLIREGQYVSAGQLLFTVYRTGALVAEFAFPPQLAAGIRQGQKLLFHPVADRQDMQTGHIGLVEPAFGNGQNFTLARVYLQHDRYQPGQLLTASVPVVHANSWWVPKKAVWRLGNKAVVFRKTRNAYVPAAVSTGAAGNDMVQVTTDIGGWAIASNAWYLVDSESFIKTGNNLQQ